MELNPTEHAEAMYRTLTSLVVPRPIGWISTLDADGRDNLAPYSYFNAVSSRPPVVMFSAGDRDGESKDSPRNAIETGEFVANLVTEELVEAMDATSAGVGESEFDFAGLDRAESAAVAPPRVANALACLECTVRETLRVGSNTLVFGDVVHVHVADSLTTDGAVDSRRVEAVGRLGGPHYSRVDVMEFTRQY